MPAITEVRFYHRMEIRRRRLIPGISRYETGRHIECAAKRNDEMCKVTAHAGAIRKHVTRARIHGRRSGLVIDVLFHPLADGLHTSIAGRKISELAHRETVDC